MIFISHSSKDDELAREMGRRLAGQHHPSVFLDLDPEKGIVAGQSWERTLYRKLRSCRAVIALCTDHYLSSHWCFAEIALARMEGKHIVALLADPLSDDARLPAILTGRQFIDLRKNPEDGYRRLWRGLKEEDILGVAGEWDPTKNPYLGLSAFHEEHAPLFFGREAETRVGLELLDRGAPGLIMVLGSSGSGKSSLVRAGMVPRLRREPQQWIVLDPFRPGTDPFGELATVLERGFRRYAPEHASRVGDWETIRGRLMTAAEGLPKPKLEEVDIAAEAYAEVVPAGDERVHRLVRQLEELRGQPPERAGDQFREFLDWSLEDLKRITGAPLESSTRPSGSSAGVSALIEIAALLKRRAPDRKDARVLLIIDQFEELLGHDDPAHPANRFLGLLGASVGAEKSPLMALGTMRSDFLGIFQRNPALRGIDFESLSLGPLQSEGMRRIVLEPAKLGALELEGDLVDRVLFDAGSPDALPLLSFTLWKLWNDCHHDGKLRIAEYERLGGVQGAVAAEADLELDAAKRGGHEENLRLAFLRMVRVTEDGNFARKAVGWDEPEIRRVAPTLERFVGRRLLVTRMEGEIRTVEVAHEALFRSWTPLKTWLDEHRSALLLGDQIRREAAAWEEAGRAADALWRGGRLQQARELMHGRELEPLERAFVSAGLRRRQRLQWTGGAITFIVFALLGAAALYSNAKRQEAEEEKIRALDLARVAVGRQLLGEDPIYAALVLAEVTRPDSTRFATRTLSHLRSCVLPDLELRHDDAVVIASFNHDGSRVVTASRDGTARVWNAATGEAATHPLVHKADVLYAAFSHDGRRVVTASDDKTARIWDARTGEPVGDPIVHEGKVSTARFSPDDSKIVTASVDGPVGIWSAADGSLMASTSAKEDEIMVSAEFSPDGQWILTTALEGSARLWNSKTGEARDSPPFGTALNSAAFDPEGKRVVTASQDQGARVWTLDGTPLTDPFPPDGSVGTAVFSPDGKWVLTADGEGGADSARIWDATTGKLRNKPLKPLQHKSIVYSALFSLDGSRVITASADGTARVWDAETGKPLGEPLQHRGPVVFAAFSPTDSSRLVTAATQGVARLWNLETSVPPVVAAQHDGKDFNGASFNPDASLFVTASADSSARVWDVASGEPRSPPLQHGNKVLFASMSNDGTRVVSAGVSGFARIWDVTTGRQLAELPHGDREVRSAQFSTDGRMVITASNDEIVRIWRADGGILLKELLHAGQEVRFASFSPDGSLVASASSDGNAYLWDVASDKIVAQLSGQKVKEVTFVAFSTDGSRLVTASEDLTARVWDTVNGTPVTQPLKGHEGLVAAASFDHDTKHLVTASQDATTLVWDARTGEQLIEPFAHNGMWVIAAAFRPDGSQIVTITANGRVWTSQVTGAWVQERIRASTRVCLTPDFRQQHLGESPADAFQHSQKCEQSHDRKLDPIILDRYRSVLPKEAGK